MKPDAVTVRVTMDAKIFRDFALFDTLRHQRRWRSPALFAAVLLVSSCVCFAMRGRAEGAALLGGVLLAVGLGLPGAYFLNFYLSIRAQVKKMGLDRPRTAYALVLSRDGGLSVSTEAERAEYPWEALHAAYRTGDCSYLYVNPRRAFLLPDRQIEGGPESLWTLLNGVLPAEKRIDCRR